jgi:uracil-DNA glycosylase
MRVRQCRLCEPGLPLGAKPIVQADPAARILIAGQAPGRLAHRSGTPFDDPSGDRLRRWLGVDRPAFYDPTKFAIVPMGLCYPGTGKSGDVGPRPACAETWRKDLLAALPNVELTLVIGQYAHAWHLAGSGQGSLTDTVARWRDYWPTVLPMPHPSPRNTLWIARNPWFEAEVVPMLRARVAAMLD